MPQTKITPVNADSYSQLAQALGNHGCVILPTETVYGLAARADSQDACTRLYAIKGRSFDKPLPICVLSVTQAEEIAHVCILASTLMDAFWPGPLTLVLPLKEQTKLAPRAQAPSKTVALRHPDCEWARYLSDMGWSEPLALTSANSSGAPSPVTAQQAVDSLDGGALKQIDLIIDGGPCAGGVESTIIEIKDERSIMLREGAIKTSAFKKFDMKWITP